MKFLMLQDNEGFIFHLMKEDSWAFQSERLSFGDTTDFYIRVE